MKHVLYAGLALALAACGGPGATPPENQLAANDFDSLDGWMAGADAPSLTKEKAHSGGYSVKIDKDIEYSLGYTNPLGKLSSSRVRKLKLRGWVFLPSNQASGQLVTQLQNPDTPAPLSRDGLDLLNEGKAKGFNKWIEIEHVVEVPETTTYATQLKIYLWKAGSPQPVYLDDLRIERAE